ncbi:MAG: hypothetical protein ICV60_22035 [Pyrinomonadaceae bacterium]|nr:hypothetical protein [Pyrinomonadaceae bacterium]
MKRRFLFGLLPVLAAYMMVGVIAFAGSNATQRRALPLGRYACVRADDSSPLPDLKLLSRDKYENADKGGIYVYEAGLGRIEWLTGPIPKQRVGFYIPKGGDNAQSDTIVIRDRKDVDEGVERDLWRCNLAQ